MNLNPSGRLKSFAYAFRGLKIVMTGQKNFRIHISVACIVILAGLYERLTESEWCIIIVTIFLVLALEVVNTALEKLVDFISPGFHEQAAIIKDISAAAVLLAATGAVIIGLIIFLPRILQIH
jgi:diacylglycerol kinase